MIEDAYDNENKELHQEYDNYERWVIEPRVIRMKKCVKVEIIIRVKTTSSTYSLCMNQRDYCESNRLKINAKRTGDEYTKKIGFLSGVHVKLASPDAYIKEIMKKTNIPEKAIDIVKIFTYKKKERLKVLVIYVVESLAPQINEALCKMKSPRYIYYSYKSTDTNERSSAMCNNDRHNINAKYESIYNAKLDDKVWNGTKEDYVDLEEVLMMAKEKEQYLFLAAKEGNDRLRKSINVVVNPSTKMASKAWLLEEFPSLSFKEVRSTETSGNADDFSINKEYKERLKEFLRPSLTHALQNNNRVGKNVKTYAQILGINKE